MLENDRQLSSFPEPYAWSSMSLFRMGKVSTYDSLRASIELFNRGKDITEYIQSQDTIVLLDLFSGEGHVPLYLLYWLAKKQAINTHSRIQIHTITLNDTPQYTNENLAEIISGNFFNDDWKGPLTGINELMEDGTITSDILSRTTVNHHYGNVFELVQRIPDESASLVTTFSCHEAFYDHETYFRRLPLPNGELRGEVDIETMIKQLLLARTVRDSNFARIIKPNGFLLQCAGCGPVKGLTSLDPEDGSYAEYPVISQKL